MEEKTGSSFLDDLFKDFPDLEDDNDDDSLLFAEEPAEKSEQKEEPGPTVIEPEKSQAEEPLEEEPKKNQPVLTAPKIKTEETEIAEGKTEASEQEPETSEETRHKKAQDEDLPADKKEEAASDNKDSKEEEKPAKTKRRARSKSKEKPELEGDILKDTETLDLGFMKSLLVLPGKEFTEQMQEIETLMDQIDLPPDLDTANAKVMYSKNFILGKKLDSVMFAWQNMYENLTNKDTGLMKRVKDQAKLTTDGTERERELAANLALANYSYQGRKIDLCQYANALRAANSFLNQARDFQKTTSIALNSFVKMRD